MLTLSVLTQRVFIVTASVGQEAGHRLAESSAPGARQAAFQVSMGCGLISGFDGTARFLSSCGGEQVQFLPGCQTQGLVSPWLRAALCPFNVGPPNTGTCFISKSQPVPGFLTRFCCFPLPTLCSFITRRGSWASLGVKSQCPLRPSAPPGRFQPCPHPPFYTFSRCHPSSRSCLRPGRL